MKHCNALPIAVSLIANGHWHDQRLLRRRWPGASFRQGNAETLALRQKAAETTHRIVVKYRPTPGRALGTSSVGAAAAVEAMATPMSQSASMKVAHFSHSGNGAQIFQLEENLPLAEVDRVIAKLSANPAVEYVEANT